MNTIINAILYDRFVGVMIGFSIIILFGFAVYFFTEVEEDPTTKPKHKRAAK